LWEQQVGCQKEFYDSVRKGTIEMGILGLIMQADFEKVQAGEWPFLYKDFKQYSLECSQKRWAVLLPNSKRECKIQKK
jgi:TRAP-type C4-dicarboxylate transport system substrate-binding protein